MPEGPDQALEEEIAAIFARLREEVRASPATAPANAPASALGARRLRARGEAERLWPVTADRPLERRAGLRGLVLRPVKVVLRKLMRWYVEPLAADQRGFNEAALKLIDDLDERVARLEERLGHGDGAQP